MDPRISKLLLLTAVVFFIIAALIAGGAITASAPWLLPAGLAAFAAAFLVA